MGIFKTDEQTELMVNIVLPEQEGIDRDSKIHRLNALMDQIDLFRFGGDRKYKVFLKNNEHDKTVIVYQTKMTIYSDEIYIVAGFIAGINQAKHLPSSANSLKRFSDKDGNHHLGVEW